MPHAHMNSGSPNGYFIRRLRTWENVEDAYFANTTPHLGQSTSPDTFSYLHFGQTFPVSIGYSPISIYDSQTNTLIGSEGEEVYFIFSCFPSEVERHSGKYFPIVASGLVLGGKENRHRGRIPMWKNISNCMFTRFPPWGTESCCLTEVW